MHIRQVTFYTHQLDAQRRFYHEQLGLPLKAQNTEQFTLQLPQSTLCFRHSDTPCQYHFAFNIPPYSEQQAAEWLRQKDVTLQAYEGAEIVDFEAWNAKSMYFYDPAHNIVELIARRELKAERLSQTPFSAQHLLSISEVGVPTTDVAALFAQLSAVGKIQKYSGDGERFCAAGDVNGLFILINKEQKKWIPNDDPAESYPNQTLLELPSGEQYELCVPDFTFKQKTQ